MGSPQAYTLLFDGDCRICSAFARAVRFLDVRRSLAIRPIQQSGEFLRGIPAEERLRAAHAVAPDGHVTSGSEAMPSLLAALVGDSELERRIRKSPGSMSLLGSLYQVMAQVRGQLTCAVGSSSAARSPR